MHLFFDKLTITRFKAYREEAVIPLERMGTGLWFVKGSNLVNPRLGSNGVGKSTLFDALCWVLYGKSVGGHRTPDMKGWGGKEAPEVTVEISAGPSMSELDRFVIRRKGVSNGLWMDGKVCSQETIDRLIGLSYENFLHTIVLGQGKPLFFDLGAQQKMEVLSETLNLNKWDDRIDRARKQANAIDLKLRVADTELVASDANIARIDDSLADLKAKSRAWENERADAEERKQRQIQELEKRLKGHQQAFDDADLAFDSAETELRHAQASLDQAQADGRTHIKAVEQATAQLVAANRVVDDLIVQREKHQDGDACSYCGSRLDAKAGRKHYDAILDKLEDARADADALRKKLDAAKQADSEAQHRERQHSDDIRKFRNASNDAVDKRTRAQGQVQSIKAEIDVIKRAKTENMDRVNPYESLLADARDALREAKITARKLEEKVRRLSSDRERTKYWVEGFKLVRLQLIDEVLAELEGVTQTLLSSVGLDQWRVRYDIDKENKNGSVKTGLNVSMYQPEYESAVVWDLFSGGEKQRLRLIGAVALSEVLLRRAGVECELLVLDEPTRNLSPEGVRDAVDFLTDRAAQQLVIYIDHAAIDTNRMRGVLRVTKDANGPRLAVA